MIWFSCKQCGKKHHRPDNQVGTMIFCDCGQGLRVPWASTIPEPELTEESLPLPPIPPRPEAVPAARAVPVEVNDVPQRPSVPLPPSPPAAMPPRRVRAYRKVNADFCLNHDETPRTQTCADCRIPFCDACVVSFQSQSLCAPCKNFRLRALSRPPQTSILAVLGVVVGLVGGPVAFCLGSVTMTPQLNPHGSVLLALVYSLLGLLIPSGAVALSSLALREIETKANRGGRGLAMTSLFMGLLGVMWNLSVGMLVIVQQITG